MKAGDALGPYRILEKLGAGGMGEVYKARDTRLDRTVAIKVLPEYVASDAQLKQRFEREAKTLAALNHPHICHIHDVGSQDGIDYLVMEHLAGETLAQRLTKGALPLDQALQVAIQIADGLDKAHRTGIVHRDLKTGNIMLTKTGAGAAGAPQAKLLDFGLAKLRPMTTTGGIALSQAPTVSAPLGASPGEPLTGAGTILGTFQYMAPEQLEGHEADARTDIFAFGAVVYEMVTGKKAFEGTSQASLIGAILHTDPAPMSSLQPVSPSALDRVVKKCLAKSADDRWQSAKDLHDELQWIAESGRQAAVTTPIARSEASAPARSSKRARLWAGLAFVCFTATLGLVGWMFRATVPAGEVRFGIAAPEGAGMDAFALAKDGKALAFVAGDRLFVRPIDRMAPIALEGTAGAQNPFWSPDGESIGFFADGKLKVVRVNDAAVRIVCDALGQRTWGDWSERNEILFSTDLTSAIQLVSAEGGTPTAVTAPGAGQGDLHPTFLPDGRRFLYVRGPGAGELRQGSLDGKEDTLVTAPAGRGQFVAPFLIFLRNREVFAQPFDPGRAMLSGRPVSLASVGAPLRVTGFQNLNSLTSEPGFSVTGAALAFKSFVADTDTELVWFARSGERLSAIGGPGVYRNVELSPDGASVAVQRSDNRTYRSDIWVIDLAQGVERRITADSANGRVIPVWTPDGKSVASREDQGGLVARVSVDDPGTQAPLSGMRFDPNSYSPDGRYLVFTQLNPGTNRDVGVLPLSGNRPPFLLLDSSADETHGQVSPDGRWIAYESNEATREADRGDVYIRPFPAGGQAVRVSATGGVQPRWRRDGRELFFLDPADGRLMAVSVETATALRVGVPTPLFETKIRFLSSGLGTNAYYDATGDGQRFIVATGLGGSTEPPVSVVLNWQEVLKRLVQTN